MWSTWECRFTNYSSFEELRKFDLRIVHTLVVIAGGGARISHTAIEHLSSMLPRCGRTHATHRDRHGGRAGLLRYSQSASDPTHNRL
jgi:hypothetical protein